MKKGEVFTGYVEKLSFPNKGVVRIIDSNAATDDKTERERVIVKNVLPGQTVHFMVNKYRNHKAEGRLLEVLEKSPLETREAKCPHFGECGGCCFQTLPYEQQLELKAGQVKELLDVSVCGEYEFQHIKGSPSEWGYRNKMEFSFGDEHKDGPLTLGLHKKGSFYDIMTTADCKIVNEDYGMILTTVLDYCRLSGMTYYHKMTRKGYLRHLLIRRASTTGEVLVSLVTTSQYDGEDEAVKLRVLKERLLDLDLNGSIVGILHCINDNPADMVRADSTEVLYGKDFFFEQLMGQIFRISTFSFFQTNSFGAEVLYGTVREFVGETRDKVIFDLYTGTGTIAQILAPVAKKVIGVELVEEAVTAARENAMLNDLSNCEFITGDVLKVIGDIEDKPDIIVLDPPREGIHQKALRKIIDYNVDRIVYISCKPTSLVKDLEMLQGSGYMVEKVRCVDMFCQTGHVETVLLLNRIK